MQRKLNIRITKGERSDRIEARRTDGSAALFEVPHKGPVPHDAVHLIVERELGLQAFWELVVGGADPDEIGRMAALAGHPSAKRADVPDDGFVPVIQAERIVEAFEADLWGGGSDNAMVRAMAASGCEQSSVPVPALSDAAIDRIRSALASFRDCWAALSVGAVETLHWNEGVDA